MKVYKIAKAWRVITYVLGPILIIPFGILIFLPIVPNINFDINIEVYYWFILPFSIIMLFIIIVAFVNTIIGKFIIDKNKIYIKGLFNNKQIYINDIKGYRVSDHFTFIESRNNKTKIKLSNYYKNRNEIQNWLILNYPNLEEVDRVSEKQEILSKHELGWTIEERELKLLKYKRLAKLLNWSGSIIAISSILLIKTFSYVILLCVAYPIFCLLAILFSNGLITIDERKETVYPTVFWAFFSTTSVVFLRSLLYFKVYDYENVWFLTGVISVSFFLILLISNKGFIFNKFEKPLTILMFSVFIVFGYSFGTVINLNCILDDSQPKLFKTKVLSKSISKGKTTNYNLALEKWNNQKESKNTTVSKEFYEAINTNDSVTIKFMNGKLNIPWFEIQQDK